jgi:UDP-galactopyranose mutase
MTDENMQRREQYMAAVSELEQQGTHLFVGRLAEYKYYNMDQVILRVFERLEQAGYR